MLFKSGKNQAWHTVKNHRRFPCVVHFKLHFSHGTWSQYGILVNLTLKFCLPFSSIGLLTSLQGFLLVPYGFLRLLILSQDSLKILRINCWLISVPGIVRLNGIHSWYFILQAIVVFNIRPLSMEQQIHLSLMQSPHRLT